MNARLVGTPIASDVVHPVQREGGLDARLLPAFAATGAAEAQLARLGDPRVLVVTTGQQPGLFTGPLYTIYKALSAAALARHLEAEWNRPVVPVFWSAGDDHDFAEAAHAEWLTDDGRLRHGLLRHRPPDAPLTPMYRELLGTDVLRPLDELIADLPVGEFRDDTEGWLRRSYTRDATLAGAYRAALVELLGPAGVIVFESTHPSAKEAAAPQLLRALDCAASLDRALAARGAELTGEGRDPGVLTGDGASLVMLEAAQGRDRLVADDGQFAARRSGVRFTRDDLERIARKEPQRLSPNVLLRPVVESALLPTVAYVAGPGELRYLALTPPVYELLHVTAQTPVPRWSGVLVEPRVDRTIDRFGITLEELLDPGSGIETRLVRQQLPPAAPEALEAIRRQLTEHYARLAEAAGDVDPTLVKFVEAHRNRGLAATNDVEKKLLRHLRRREDTELRQLRVARNSVLPGGRPQERTLTVAPFLARYGERLLDAVREAAADFYAGALERTTAGK